jgi:hypothetical protein
MCARRVDHFIQGVNIGADQSLGVTLL